MNKETRIKRTIGIIILVFVIGVLTFGMFLPSIEKNIETNTTIQSKCEKGYAIKNGIKLLSNKKIETPLDFDLTFETQFVKQGVKDCAITDIDILNEFTTEVSIDSNDYKTITTDYESTGTNKTKFTLKSLTLKDMEKIDIDNFNIKFQFTTPLKHPNYRPDLNPDEYRVYMGGNKYDIIFNNFKSYELNPSPEVPVIEPPFTNPDLPIDKPETKPEEGISGIEVALITTGVLIGIVLIIIVGFSIWDNKKPIEQQRKPRSKHYLETKTDKELELIITAPTNKHTKDKAKEILNNRKNNNV